MATSRASVSTHGASKKTTLPAACPRCGGLMVGEISEDALDLAGPSELSAWRCVQCGEFIDPVVLQNRRRQQIEAA